MMRAASRKIALKPECPVYLSGYAGDTRLHSTTSVHDAPMAVALLLEVDNRKLLFLELDVLAVEEERIAPLKKDIASRLHMDPDDLIVSAVHSHSLPSGFFADPFSDKSDTGFYDQVLRDLPGALEGLDEQLQECEALYSRCKVHGYYSKRSDITAPYDDEALVIRFVHDNENIAAILKISCHGTVLGPDNMDVTVDFLGAIRDGLAKEIGVTPYTVTGASGDISNRQYRQGNDFRELERVSKGVLQILSEGLKEWKPLHLAAPKIESWSYGIDYDCRPNYPQYRQALEKAQAVMEDPGSSFDEKKLARTEIYVMKERLEQEHVSFTVKGRVIHMGELTIATFPGELASIFGLQLKEACPNDCFLLIGYCDDYQGYFIEEDEYGKTYETVATLTPKGEPEKICTLIKEKL